MGFDSLSASSSATTTAASGTSGTRRSLFAVQERRLDIPIDKIRPILEYIQRRLAIRMLGGQKQTRSELINFVLVFGAAAVAEHVLMFEVGGGGDEAHEVSGRSSSRILRLIVLGYAVLRLALGYDDLGRLVVENRRSRHHARLAVTVVVAVAELCRRSRVVAIGLRHWELFVEGVEERHSGGSGGRSRKRVVVVEKTRCRRVELGSVMRLMMQIERRMRRRLGDWDRARD